MNISIRFRVFSTMERKDYMCTLLHMNSNTNETFSSVFIVDIIRVELTLNLSNDVRPHTDDCKISSSSFSF